jgi:hypothetical protein
VKQRHRSSHIFESLKPEHGFRGGCRIVKDDVHTSTLRGQEMFVPLAYPAGEAQVDFGEAMVVMAGVERTLVPRLQRRRLLNCDKILLA